MNGGPANPVPRAAPAGSSVVSAAGGPAHGAGLSTGASRLGLCRLGCFGERVDLGVKSCRELRRWVAFPARVVSGPDVQCGSNREHGQLQRGVFERLEPELELGGGRVVAPAGE